MNSRESGPAEGKRAGYKIYILIFFSVLLISATTLFSLYKISLREGIKSMEENEANLVEQQKETIRLDFETIVSGLFLFADHTSTRISESNLTGLAVDYKDYSNRMKLYDQVRYLDNSGLEVVRINFNEGTPSIVPKEKLQNKGFRYYFKDTFLLNRGEIFVSPLDLNIEGGIIERPTKARPEDDIFNSIWRPEREGTYSKPMIRFGTPVFDKGGVKRGVILFNYFGNILLKRFEKIGINSAGKSLLVNKDGYWLKGPSNDLEWGFMQEHDYCKEANIKNDFPEASKTIFAESKGQLRTEEGLFTFNTVYPIKKGMRTTTGSGQAFADSASNLEADEYVWKVVSYVPSSVFKERAGMIFRRLFIAYLGFIVILAGGIFYYAKRDNKNGQQL